jgi:hypothetical protein
MKLIKENNTVIKIIKPTFKNITDELCCWEVHALIDCYGGTEKKIFRYTHKSFADKIKPEYSYLA